MSGYAFAKVKLGKNAFLNMASKIDWVLWILIGLVGACGLVNLFSATHETAHQVKFENQLLWFGLGFSLMFILTVIDYRNLQKLSWISLVIVVVMILAVKFFSDPIKGSTRWLLMGGFRMQPSEMAKIALILVTARLLHRSSEKGGSLLDYLPKVFVLTLPILLVLWQPDLGSASLSALIVLSMAVVLAKKVWPYFVGGGLGVLSLPLFWTTMEEYQKGRVRAFLGWVDEKSGATWQTDQSLNAVGSGQFWGKGFQNATQNQYEFLPEHWTDFPFSVWAEEWGFVGSVALLGLFFLLILWILGIALQVRDRFGQAICVGVSAMIFWHLLINVMMVTGMAPVVGVTLPMVSYGGSSMVTFFMALGLVSSVSSRRKRL